MKIFSNLSFTEKIELWVANSYLLFSIFHLLNNIADPYAYFDNKYHFEIAKLHFNPISHYFLPNLSRVIAIYIFFMVLHFIATKNILKGTKLARNIVLAIALYMFLVIVRFVTEIIMKQGLFNDENRIALYSEFLIESFIRILDIYWAYTIYLLIKHIFRVFSKKWSISTATSGIMQDCLILLIIWIVVLWMLNHSRFPDDYRIIWFVVGFPTIVLYGYLSDILIPKLKSREQGFGRYFLRVVIISFSSGILVSLAYYTLYIWTNWTPVFMMVFFYVSTQLFITPVIWWLYGYREARSKEISGLQTSLGQTTADLNFLRSQINPHFLFNALNTLYATSLQENAERTGEGIQKLGDMMRFMLHENVQEKTSLLKEVEYLNNYIALQKLRIQESEDIEISIEIQDELPDYQITPMLLIPFVENAFKHGISLREYSYIKIALRVGNGTLFFEVNNSVHTRSNFDPEQDKSGIGLENVKQRLQLLYPGKHELIVNQSDQVFSAQLILNITN